MKILICGAGRITRELLKRLAEGWEVVLVDKSAEQLAKTAPLFPNVGATHEGDASSPVVMDRLGLKECDYVLALTSDDEVNLAVMRHARESGVRHLSALVFDAADQKPFSELGAHVIMGPGILAQNLSHYLQDPRLHVTPLVSGAGSVYEVDASHHFRVVGKRASYFNEPGSRLAALFRKGKLIFPKPKTPIKSGDKLVIVGEQDIFEPVCRLLECGDPHFPMAYGQGMLLVLGQRPVEDPGEYNPVLMEGMYLAQNTMVRQVTVLCPGEECGVEKAVEEWPKSVQVEVRPAGDAVRERMAELCHEAGIGLVVMPPPRPSFFKTLVGAPLVELAHEMDTPLLLARTTFSYDSILVPYNGTAMAELALEVAVDLSRQVDAKVSVAVVEEASFLSGRDEAAVTDTLLERVRELSHVHKTDFDIQTRRGNPVREVADLSKDYGLMVLGIPERDRGFLTPNIGDLMARKAACSVLLLPS